jgi:hypothetical protein
MPESAGIAHEVGSLKTGVDPAHAYLRVVLLLHYETLIEHSKIHLNVLRDELDVLGPFKRSKVIFDH